MLFYYQGNQLKSGIYEIRNRHTNRSYIGQTRKFRRRWELEHKSLLLKGTANNRFLQNDFNQCFEILGHTDFLEFHILDVLEEYSAKELNILEDYWLKQYKKNKYQLYNFRTEINPEQIWPNDPKITFERMSKAQIIIWSKRSEEEKNRMLTNLWAGITEESLKKRSETAKITASTKEAKEKRSICSKEMWANRSEEDKQYILTALAAGRTKECYERAAEKNRGRKYSDETIRKMSIAKKGKNRGSDHYMFGKKHSAASIEKMSKSRKEKNIVGMKHPRAKIYENIKLLSPEGEIFTRIECLSVFAREHNLSIPSLHNLINGKSNQHKGWKLIKSDLIKT